MKIWLARVGKNLVATDDDSERVIRRLGEGECAIFEVIRPRSVAMHRMYFGLCRTIGQNQDPPRSEDSIDNELRVLAGHYDVLYAAGHEVRIPKRIAFAKLTHDEWMALWPSIEVAIRERFGETYLQEQAA